MMPSNVLTARLVKSVYLGTMKARTTPLPLKPFAISKHFVCDVCK